MFLSEEHSGTRFYAQLQSKSFICRRAIVLESMTRQLRNLNKVRLAVRII